MLSNSKQKISPLEVQRTVREQHIPFFTVREFGRLFQVPERKARYFLESYTRREFFIRLRKGLYALRDALPGEEVIANALYKPSYLSLEYVLSRAGVMLESVYTVTSVTTKATATFDVSGREFSYRKIKRSAYTGYVPQKSGDRTVFIAEPEKALADYLYFVSIGRKQLPDRLDYSRIDQRKVREYLRLFGRKHIDTIADRAFSLSVGTIE